MKPIFCDAKFGEVFIRRDKTRVIFISYVPDCRYPVKVLTEEAMPSFYSLDGSFYPNVESTSDVVEKVPVISDENLRKAWDKLFSKYYSGDAPIDVNEFIKIIHESIE